VADLSVRARNALYSVFRQQPTPEGVRSRATQESPGYEWNWLRRINGVGIVLSTEIAEWSGIPIPEKHRREKCQTCGRVKW
jgi:hypothetical protein